jgi:NTE family protein
MSIDIGDKPYKVGLALSGGGARGFAHLGALKFLNEFGIKPEIISGTSAGSIMGALYADGYSPEEILDMFEGKEFSEFAQLQLPKAGIFDSSRFHKFLKKHFRSKRIEDLSIPLVIVATDLDNGKSVEFSSGSIADAVTASCTIPILFSPLEIGGVHYVDGGVFKNFPVSNIRDKCEKLIGVNVSPLVSHEYKQTILNIAERSYHYLFRANTLEDRELCDILVEPVNLDSYKTFDLENMETIAHVGYESAAKSFESVMNVSMAKSPFVSKRRI